MADFDLQRNPIFDRERKRESGQYQIITFKTGLPTTTLLFK